MLLNFFPNISDISLGTQWVRCMEANGDGKCLVVYYSFEGNTRWLANAISREIKAEMLEIKPVKEIKAKGFMKYFWGGRQVMMKKMPLLEPFNIELDGFDMIFLGSPVWAYNCAPPMRTFSRKYLMKGKKVVLFCSHEGGPGKIFTRWEKMLSGVKVVGRFDTFAPLKKGQKISTARAVAWAKKMLSN